MLMKCKLRGGKKRCLENVPSQGEDFVSAGPSGKCSERIFLERTVKGVSGFCIWACAPVMTEQGHEVSHARTLPCPFQPHPGLLTSGYRLGTHRRGKVGWLCCFTGSSGRSTDGQSWGPNAGISEAVLPKLPVEKGTEKQSGPGGCAGGVHSQQVFSSQNWCLQ